MKCKTEWMNSIIFWQNWVLLTLISVSCVRTYSARSFWSSPTTENDPIYCNTQWNKHVTYMWQNYCKWMYFSSGFRNITDAVESGQWACEVVLRKSRAHCIETACWNVKIWSELGNSTYGDKLWCNSEIHYPQVCIRDDEVWSSPCWLLRYQLKIAHAQIADAHFIRYFNIP